MAEMIRDRQPAAEKVDRHDLLTSLLAANDHDLDLATLSEDEIISMHTLTIFPKMANNGYTRQHLHFPGCWT